MKNISAKKIIFPASLLITAALLACSSTKKVESTVATREDSKKMDNRIGYENEASWYTELNFEKGSARLDQEDYTAIQDLVKKSMDAGRIDEIKIITWADQEYPSKNAKKLPSGQKQLADRRNERIKDFLKESYPSLDVRVYNMAERPNALENLFQTSDARTKKTIESAGISYDPDHHSHYPSKASSTLILSILKERQ